MGLIMLFAFVYFYVWLALGFWMSFTYSFASDIFVSILVLVGRRFQLPLLRYPTLGPFKDMLTMAKYRMFYIYVKLHFGIPARARPFASEIIFYIILLSYCGLSCLDRIVLFYMVTHFPMHFYHILINMAIVYFDDTEYSYYWLFFYAVLWWFLWWFTKAAHRFRVMHVRVNNVVQDDLFEEHEDYIESDVESDDDNEIFIDRHVDEGLGDTVQPFAHIVVGTPHAVLPDLSESMADDPSLHFVADYDEESGHLAAYPERDMPGNTVGIQWSLCEACKRDILANRPACDYCQFCHPLPFTRN